MNRTWIKKFTSHIRDFAVALCIAFIVKYLIEGISPCEKVTSPP
jgi:hypothetical protein